jgi:type I restriction enzyme M protein
MRISMMNLVLHGISKARLKRANVLSEIGGQSEDDLNRRYKVILSNPPFAGVLPKESIRHDLPTNSKKSELLFLALMMESLAPGGRCAVVVPEGALFGSSLAHKSLRQKLVQDFEILAVVSLPAGVFKPYAGVKTSVLVFRKSVSAPKKGKVATQTVWFYEVKNDGFDPDKIQGGVRPETPDRNEIPGLLAAWNQYKKSDFRVPPGVEANTILPPGSEEPNSWWAIYESVEAGDFNLTASRYKPQIGEKAPGEDPAELIRETLAIEREIADGLEKLLKEIEQ